ncbi:MAG: hypothetical protein AB7T27_06110 [Kiritimatiellia bacterium]
MTANKFIMAVMLAVALALPCAQAARVGGNADFAAESINAGGISAATNAAGTFKLSGSIAQHGFTALSTNVSGRLLQSGFWWADDVQILEPADITGLVRGTNSVGITFTMVSGNWYQVLYVTDSEGGVPAGTHAFTNEAAAFFATGASTTVWHDVSSPPDRARFYLIKCQ